MKVKLLFVGKTEEKYLNDGVAIYKKRLENYISIECIEIEVFKKNQQIEMQKDAEAKAILKYISKSSSVVLLDENATQHSSLEFSQYLQKKMNSGIKELLFIVGGSYGFSDELKRQFKEKIALSKMTFSHQMVRLFFIEQLYRGFTILRGEKYHHF